MTSPIGSWKRKRLLLSLFVAFPMLAFSTAEAKPLDLWTISQCASEEVANLKLDAGGFTTKRLEAVNEKSTVRIWQSKTGSWMAMSYFSNGIVCVSANGLALETFEAEVDPAPVDEPEKPVIDPSDGDDT